MHVRCMEGSWRLGEPVGQDREQEGHLASSWSGQVEMDQERKEREERKNYVVEGVGEERKGFGVKGDFRS